MPRRRECYVRLTVAGGIGTVRLDRSPANALTAGMQRGLVAAFRGAVERRDVAAVVGVERRKGVRRRRRHR
ncbi:MAG: hypothetical protein ACRCYX_10235 [Dermatophilaceae bacterium]